MTDDRPALHRLGRASGVLPDTTSAAVLIGGKSRRMGAPKALLRLDASRPTLLESVVTVLRGVAPDVFLVGRPQWPLPATLVGMRTVTDGGDGPADGVIAALAAAQHPACLIVGCDMPFLDPPLLRELIATAERESKSVIIRDAAGAHPLHAVYRRADLGRIEALVAGGERSLVTITAELKAVAVDLDGVSEDDPWRWSTFNINTPAQLAVARARVARRDGED